MGPRRKKVAVVGAGTSGLVSVKECLEAGLSVQCFEKGADVGGQWIYTPTMTDAAARGVHSSVYNGVILNSFRDTSAFSDFPYDPARYPAYFSHRLQLGYLNEYAEHFKLREHIRFGTEVLACRPVNRRAGEGGDGNRRVGWTLRVRKVGEGGDGEEVVEELEFDALMVATGAFSKPRLPDLEGQDEFKGEVLHSHYYRTPGPFEDMRVAVVGFGDSAVDIACEVGPQAKELHLITRRGGWVLPRFLFGRPLEAWNGRASQTWIPQSVSNYLQTKGVQFVQGKLPSELQCGHRLLAQNTTIRSDFHEKVATGVIIPHRSSLLSLSDHEIRLSNGESLEVDVVILCTGYHMSAVPLIPLDAIASRDAPAPHVDLYKQLVSPYYDGLYVMGLLQLFGPHGPAAEAQARFAAAMVSGTIPRPDRDEMLEDIRKVREWKTKTFLNSDAHVFTLYSIQYMDELARPLGAVPTVWKMLVRTFTGNPLVGMKLFWAVFFGPVSGAQWRLTGHGAKEKLATATVLRVAAGKERLNDAEKVFLEVN